MTQKPKGTGGVVFVLKIFIFAALASGALTASASQILLLPNGARYLDDRFVVMVKQGTPALGVNAVANGFAVTGIPEIDLLCQNENVVKIEKWYPYPIQHNEIRQIVERMYIFHVAAGVDVIKASKSLAAATMMESSELYSIPVSFRTPNDPSRPFQWYLGKIRAYDSWDLINVDTTRYSIIGIVDTGVDWIHPDLADNMWINSAEDLNHNGTLDAGDINGIDDDGNGFIDDVIGWDMVYHDNNPQEDTPTHGTHVAGCASEVTNNGIGGAGTGWAARLMAVKVADSTGSLIQAYQGITWAADQGAQIINCSWGSTGYLYAEQQVINAAYSAGALVVAAAGNDDYYTPPYVGYPAAYVHVLSVAATNSTDLKAGFSNYGSWVDVSAPGVSIYSTWSTNTYMYADGTSMASPIVAGLAALIKSMRRSFTPDQITNQIKNYADNIDALNPSYAGQLGTGRINAHASLLGISFVPGDVNASGYRDAADITFLVRYLKGIGATPPAPIWRADANGNCIVGASDVTYLVVYFKGGTAPINGGCPY
jgi:serine protease